MALITLRVAMAQTQKNVLVKTEMQRVPGLQFSVLYRSEVLDRL